MKKTYLSPCCDIVALEVCNLVANSQNNQNIRTNMNHAQTDNWGNSNERRSGMWE